MPLTHSLQPGASAYAVDPATISSSDSLLTFSLVNSNTNVELTAAVSFLDGTARLTVQDKNPRQPRHAVKGVLPENLNTLPFTIASKVGWIVFASKSSFNLFYNILKTETNAVVSWQDSSLVLTFSPFRVDIFHGDKPVLSMNSAGLLNYEEHRDRKEGDLDGMWEETFKTHTDTKPYGPSSRNGFNSQWL